ncbi:MAG: S-layer homology domain-containing protein [Bacillota bacterium]
MGLKPGTGGNPFADVSNTAWYCDYIKTAVEYKIISGYGDGKFGPSDKITREQAMSMTARAMNITGLKVQFADGEMDKLHAIFGDAANSADYAKNSIAACVKTGIVSGRNGNMIAPKDNITRAEVAVILQRLLQKSGLI